MKKGERATAQSGNEEEGLTDAEKIEEIRERLLQRMGEARRSMFQSMPGQQEAYYDGKATALAEAIELVSEVIG